ARDAPRILRQIVCRKQGRLVLMTPANDLDRKSTRLNSSHGSISYAVFCLKKKSWAGYDVPDVPVLTDGPNTPNGQRAFHLSPEGVGRIFAVVYQDPDPKDHHLHRTEA